MDALLVVDVGDCANELRKDLLHERWFQWTVFDQVVVQFIARTILEHEPDKRFCDNDFIQAGNVGVEELAVVMDLARKVLVILLCRFQDDLLTVSMTIIDVYGDFRLTLLPLMSLWEAR
jgi:hypothetical protein